MIEISMQAGLLIYTFSFLLGAIFMIIYRSNTMSKAINYFTLFYIFSAIGSLLIFFRVEIDNQFLSIIIANLFLVLGILLLVSGVALLTMKTPNYRFVVFVLITYFVLFIYYTYIDSNATARVISFCFISILMFLRLLHYTYMYRNSKNNMNELLTPAIIIAILTLVFRIVGIIVFSESTNDFLSFQRDSLNVAFMGISYLLIIVGLLSLITNKATKSLFESEERFKILHNASFGGIAIHNKGIILDCNQGLSNLTGFTMNELTGMDGLLLIAPNYREYIMEKIESGFEKPYEGKGIRKNGEIYPLKLEARNIPFKGEIVRVVEFRDITELKKKEFELQDNIELFEQLFTNTPVGITIVDSITGKMLNANQPYLDILGLSIDEIKTADWMQITHKDDLAADLFNMKQLNSGVIEEYHMEKKVYRKNGEVRHVELFVRPLKAKHNNRKIHFAIMNDITERINNRTEIEFLSYHDSLTGLYNRRYFEEEMKRLDNKRNLPISVIMGDVNGLKLTNDAFGHQAGDKLLKMIGNIISESIRGNDIISRWGGDEFTILLPSSDSDAANILIKRIQKKIKEASFEYGSLSISFGVDTKKEEHEDINEIFTNAEEFMYQNKLVEIDSIRGQTINTIMTTLFEKSAEVKEHSNRVSELAFAIAEKMELSKTNINDIKTMGLIHDIGKIVIDLQILDKPGKLSDEERKLIEQHPLSGSRMLNSSHEYSRLAAGVLHHHERIDGKGYPNGIKGNQIPIESKIIAVADAYDAMTAVRPYRLNPLSEAEAISELQKHSGSQFDETVVEIFVNKVLLKNIK